MAILQDADLLLWPSVCATVEALELGPADVAAGKAAILLALNFDAHTDKVYACRWLLPELLKYLVELGATPAARAAIAKSAKSGGDNAPAAVSWLEQQRQSFAASRPKRA